MHPFRTRHSSALAASSISLQDIDDPDQGITNAPKTYKRDSFALEFCASDDDEVLDAMFADNVTNRCRYSEAVGFHRVATPACYAHNQFLRCGRNKGDCDMDFYNALVIECDRKTSFMSNVICKAQANSLYLASSLAPGAKTQEAAWCASTCAEQASIFSHDLMRLLVPWF